MSSDKRNKKLKKFFVDKTTPIKRVRALISFEVGSSTDEEIQQFFSENHEQIINLIVERYSECESAPKPVRKGKHYLADLLVTIQLLRSFVQHCLRNHPQYIDELETILPKSLGYSNKHAVRFASYQILLSCLDVLYDKPHEALYSLLVESINLQPFVPEDAEQPPTSFLSGKALSPASTMPSVSESVELWMTFIAKCTEKPEKFSFWFGLLKGLYLPVLFPAVVKKVGILPLIKFPESKCFKTCPPQLQEVLSSGMAKWTRGGTEESHSEFIYKAMWPKENGSLVMALSRSFCRLPIEYATTTSRIIEKLREFLFHKVQSNKQLLDYLESPQQFYREFIQNILGVFQCVSTAETLDIHKSMCLKVLQICQEVTQTSLGKKDQSIWETVQENLLQTICEFLGNANPFSVKHISTTMADDMFRYILEIWLRSPYTTEAMWKNFSEKISRLVSWKALLDQWKDKVIQLTHVFKAHYYIPIIKEHEPPKKKNIRATSESENKESEASPIDQSIGSIPWTNEKIKKDWYTLIYILGNLNSINLPENFATALSACSSVIDLVLSTEDQIPLSIPPVIPVCQIFLPWLIEACSVEEKRNRGRLIAYSTLCKLFCRLQISSSVEVKLLVHFYRVIRQGLHSGHSSVIWTIFRHATAIFGVGLPGANILIPAFVTQISHLFRPDNKSTVPTDVQYKALQILSSLICVPNHFPSLEFNETTNADGIANSEQLRTKISSILLVTLTNNKLNPSNRICVVHSIGVLVCDDLVHKPRKEIVRECIKGLLACCIHDNDTIAISAIETITTLSQYYKELKKLSSLVENTILSLCDNIRTLISAKIERTNVIIDHYHCLLAWTFQVTGTGIPENLLEKIFDSIEIGFVGTSHSIDEFDFMEDLEQNEEDDGSLLNKQSRRSRFFDRIVVNKKQSSESFRIPGRKHADTIGVETQLVSRETANPGNDFPSGKIIAASRFFLAALMSRYNNFPIPYGATEGPLLETETTDECALYLMYNLQTIFCLEQIEASDGRNILQVTLRDCTGKYVWDCDLECETIEYKEELLSRLSTRKDTLRADSPSPFTEKKTKTPENLSLFTRKFGEVPSFQENANYEGIDPAAEMVQYLEESDGELIASGKMTQQIHGDKIEKYANLVNQQVSCENSFLDQLVEEERIPLPLKPEIPEPQSAMHLCRLFLLHMGLLEEAQRKRIHLLSLSQRLKRSLKELDKSNAREMIKIGLIYVRPGQERQQAILANDIGSERFTKFTGGLGWTIDVETHGQYRGGLDSRSTGKTATYYADESVEVIFHDITRMPTKEDDRQQIHKKRHVGNDNVHIVWSEHKREYNPATITSQFNDAHVVIYPLENGLNRVQVFKKDKVRLFGPLVSGMVLSTALLSKLVRISAINANNASRLTSNLYKKPLLCRQDLIKEINSRYKAEYPFPDFIAELFKDQPTLTVDS